MEEYVVSSLSSPLSGLSPSDALSAWCDRMHSNGFAGLDFTKLVSDLDNTASEIVTYQRDSTVQRKDLAQKTKDFRKLDDATKLSEIKGF